MSLSEIKDTPKIWEVRAALITVNSIGGEKRGLDRVTTSGDG